MEFRQAEATNLRSVNTDSRTLDIIASTYDLDSYGTRIDQSGWDLSAFLKNPVICLQHDAGGWTQSGGLPIARALPNTIRVENQKLLMTIQFPEKGVSQLADEVFSLCAAGFLNGLSVGFEANESETTEEDGSSIRIYRSCKLLEVSIVTLPANDNAVIIRARELNKEKDVDVIRGRMQEVEKLAKEEIAKHTKAAATEYVEKCVNYFEKKQPANKEATRVLKAFFKTVIKAEAPADEVEAWKRMAEAVEGMEEKVEEVKVEPVAEEKKPEEVKEEPIKPPEPQEAPAVEQKASVLIPLSVLMDLAPRLAKSYLDTAEEALRRGVPVKDAVEMIDGMNAVVTTSISTFSHGNT